METPKTAGTFALLVPAMLLARTAARLDHSQEENGGGVNGTGSSENVVSAQWAKRVTRDHND